MIRATTGGVLRSYRANLMNSFIAQNKARDTVLTQRNFNSYAEDPAAAAEAFRLRKSRMAVESQYKICNGAISKYQSAFTSLDTIDKLIDTANGGDDSTLKSTTLQMLNDPKGDARTQLTKVLDQLSDTIVQNMNQKYGENFIFAGADGRNVPFEVKGDRLYYRGVPVDAATPVKYSDNNGEVMLNNNNQVVPTGDPTGTRFLLDRKIETISKSTYDSYDTTPPDVLKNTNGDPAEFVDDKGNTYYILSKNTQIMTQEEFDEETVNAEKLKFLANDEKQFVDIGLGFQEDENGNLIESSGFDIALNGLTFLGYGLDEDGDPKNIYSIVQRLKDIASSVPEEGKWSNEVYEEFRGLVLKLEDASSKYKTEFTNLTASTTKLENNLKLLEENHYTLQEQYSDLEDVDMADAITSFLWGQYCYNAALKVGNSILGQSLMDYLN